MILYFKPRGAGLALDDVEALMDEKGVAYTVFTTVDAEPHMVVDGETLDYEAALHWAEHFDSNKEA